MTAEEANEKARADLEKSLLKRLEAGPLHTWQLGGHKDDVVLALYRMRKAGLLLYDRDHQRWRIR